MLETVSAATDLDLISYLKAIPDGRIRRGVSRVNQVDGRSTRLWSDIWHWIQDSQHNEDTHRCRGNGEAANPSPQFLQAALIPVYSGWLADRDT